MINITLPQDMNEIDDANADLLHVWLSDVLKTAKATVTFTKVDGTERVMICTLKPEMLPVVELKENAKPRKETTSKKALRVFDLEKNEWRSFTIKNLKNVVLAS